MISLTQDHEFGQRLTALAVGMDQLERHLSQGQGALDSEGLIPIYLGNDLVAATKLETWDEVFVQLDQLELTAKAYPAGSRQVFLLAMIDSLRAAAQLFNGAELGFSKKLERLVGVPA